MYFAYVGTEKEASATKLTEQNLLTLTQQLKEHAVKWKEIGMNLGFLPRELKDIEAQLNPILDSTITRLGTMLEKWIQWAPGDSRESTSSATLEALKTAVSNARLGNAARELQI